MLKMALLGPRGYSCSPSHPWGNGSCHMRVRCGEHAVNIHHNILPKLKFCLYCLEMCSLLLAYCHVSYTREAETSLFSTSVWQLVTLTDKFLTLLRENGCINFEYTLFYLFYTHAWEGIDYFKLPYLRILKMKWQLFKNLLRCSFVRFFLTFRNS